VHCITSDSQTAVHSAALLSGRRKIKATVTTSTRSRWQLATRFAQRNLLTWRRATSKWDFLGAIGNLLDAQLEALKKTSGTVFACRPLTGVNILYNVLKMEVPFYKIT